MAAPATTILTIDPTKTDVSERFVRFRGTLAISAGPTVYATGGLTVNSAASAAKATGSLVCLPKASFVDGETFTIDDGVKPPTVFEFDVIGGGVTPGNESVDISNVLTVTALDVAAIVKTAINAVVGTLLVTAEDRLNGTVYLTADQYGTIPNVAITDTVTDTGFVVTGMSGATNGSWSGGEAEGNELIEVRLWPPPLSIYEMAWQFRADPATTKVRIFGQEPSIVTAGVLTLSEMADGTAIPVSVSAAPLNVELTYKKLL